jgi:hypothetical protein
MKRLLLSVAALVAACSNSSSDDDVGGIDVDGGTTELDAATVVCGATTCDEPPAATCVDAFTLRVSLDDGACVDDACQYTTDDFVCPFGCSGGACNAYTCTPSCPTATCVPDGCGGMCGACSSGATFVTPTLLGNSADKIKLSPDGLHVAVTRNLQPLPTDCGWNPSRVGTLDVYTFGAGGQATRRIVGRRVQLGTVAFVEDTLIYNDDVDPCHGRGDLWVAHADGSSPRRIATHVVLGAELHAGVLFWHAPDPDAIDQSVYNGHIYAASLELGVPRQLALDDYMTWTVPSPDGSAVLTAGNAASTQIQRVWVTDVATGIQHALTPSSWGPKYRGPWWSPDGDHVFFLQSTTGYAPWTLTMANEDGSGRVDLSTNAMESYALTFTPDGRRVAFAEKTPGLAQDIVIRDLVAGTSARLPNVIPGASYWEKVWQLRFSRDGASVLAIAGPTDATDSRPFRFVRGPASGGALTKLVEPVGRDGRGLETVIQEAPNGMLTVMGTDTTKIIAPSGVVTSIGSVPYEPAMFDPTGQKLLIDSVHATLELRPTTGSGGEYLVGYNVPSALASEAAVGYVPFVIGWWDSLAIYPTNSSGSYPNVQFTLNARRSDSSGGGLLGYRVLRYAIAGDRLVFQTVDGALFAARRP